MTLTEQIINHAFSEENETSESMKPETLTTLTPKDYKESKKANKVSENILRKALTKIKYGKLIITDQNGVETVYEGDTGLEVVGRIQILDPRAWRSITTEGSVGLGRGYIEQWWATPDPLEVMKVLNKNIRTFDGPRNRIANVAKPIRFATSKLPKKLERKTNKENIHAHYDIGNDFFKIFLDETMTYSSGVFETTEDSMKTASLNKYNRLINKLDINPDHEVLEIGTGWGGFAIQAAKTRNCKITTTTISDEQFIEAQKRVNENELDQLIKIKDKDWRDLTGKYDRVISIEMIEAVHWRDYTKFFSKIEQCLKPDGMVGIQAICVPDKNYERIKSTEDFIRRFVFPGGFLPSVQAISKALEKTNLQLVHYEDLSEHYVKTLATWRKKFNENLDQVSELGLNDKFQRLWNFYLAYCEAAFEQRSCTLNQFTIVGPEWQPSSLAN